MRDARILVGHCVDVLDDLPEASIHACITSPPYFRLREYGAVVDWPEVKYSPLPGLPEITVPAQRCELGIEDELTWYVGHLVHVFRAVRRALRPDATLWLNLGDSWAGKGRRGGNRNGSYKRGRTPDEVVPTMRVPEGVKRKDLLGVPWRVALALQADGWWLRSEVIWHKKNAMPDPTEDRLTRVHETIFQFAKSDTYFHDAHAIREPHTQRPQRRPNGHKRRRTGPLLPEHTWSGTARDEPGIDGHPLGRNARSVWRVSTTPFKEAHFAVMASEVAERCVLAATSARGVCQSCGAPMQRIVNRPKIDDPGRAPDSKLMNAEGISDARRRRFSLSGQAFRDQRDADPAVTIGWEPGCGCSAGETVPATVLDPFSGAATTGLVALQHGRHFVGVEFSAEYAEMSRRRLAQSASQGLLFTGDGTLAPRT